MLKRENLRNYQIAGTEFIKKVPKGGLWMSMGLGKTATVLTAIVDLFAMFEIHRVLIIAPKRVALSTWPDEIKNWEHTRDLTFSVINGTPKQRTAACKKSADVHIISRDNVCWLVSQVGDHWDYDFVVIDESSSFKNHKAKRFKALKAVMGGIDRMVQLTGTPAPNGLLDVWAPTYLLDRGERLGKNITAYRRKYFYPLPNYFGWALRSKSHAEAIYNSLDDICFTIRHEDFLDLPEVIPNRIDVVLPAKALALYEKFKKDLFLELDSGDLIEAPFAADLQNKLIQVCNGAVYNEDGEFIEIHDAKLEALDSVINENPGEPILCAYNFRSDRERILKRYKFAEALDDDPATIARWNAGDIPFLLTHPASAGHGLNLQHGGSHLVWFGMNWSLELYLQFNARLARPGQKSDKVIMHQISTAGTVENKVFKALNNKKLTQDELVDFMKKPILN